MWANQAFFLFTPQVGRLVVQLIWATKVHVFRVYMMGLVSVNHRRLWILVVLNLVKIFLSCLIRIIKSSSNLVLSKNVLRILRLNYVMFLKITRKSYRSSSRHRIIRSHISFLTDKKYKFQLRYSDALNPSSIQKNKWASIYHQFKR